MHNHKERLCQDREGRQPSASQREASKIKPADTLIFDFYSSELPENKFMWFKLPGSSSTLN